MKKINWLDHIANLLVVILGISIAFYLESYKERKNSRFYERQYIEGLVEDLDSDIEQLDTLMSINERRIEALVGLSNASIGRQIIGDTVLMNYMLSIQYNPPFSPQPTTYESLKSSGKMDLISSFEQRSAIIELYEKYYLGTVQYDDAVNEHIRDFIKPFYMNHVRFNSGQSINPDFLPKNNFRNMIFAYRYLFVAKDGFYKRVKDRAEEVRDGLKNHLEKLQ